MAGFVHYLLKAKAKAKIKRNHKSLFDPNKMVHFVCNKCIYKLG